LLLPPRSAQTSAPGRLTPNTPSPHNVSPSYMPDQQFIGLRQPGIDTTL
jgi:hypothetical protein